LKKVLYLDKGALAKNSGEQVAKIARMARELGIEPATPDEARSILGLKGLDNSPLTNGRRACGQEHHFID
jgi:uncharacterized protein (DUF849 family)